LNWILILVIIVLVLVAAVFAVAWVLIRMTFVRNAAMDQGIDPGDSPAWQEYYRYAKKGITWIESQPLEKCESTSFDGLKLRGVFLPAEAETKRTIVCIHGYKTYGCYDCGAMAPFLHSLGWNLLIPDDRAHGKSEGKYIGFGNLDSQDCLTWCRWLTDRMGNDCKIVLYGISMGAASVLSAAGDPKAPEQISGVVADCGFSSGWEEVRMQLKNQFHLPSFPLLPAADFVMRRAAGYSLKGRAPIDRVADIHVPLLIIHGKSDDFVPASMGEELFAAAGSEDKHFLSVEGAVHAHSYITATDKYEEAFRELISKSDRR